jgi:transposase
MKPAYRRCCGIDVHKKTITVCILPPDGRSDMQIKKRTFRTFTRDLKQMRGWLLSTKVTEVAMESTGQYWVPVWNVLEGVIGKLILVNPQHIKGVEGYKTDPRDAEWIATLLQRELLRASYVPRREIRHLRALTRTRVHLIEEITRVKNRISQLCETGNIKVSSVATDLFGFSGRTMLKSLVEGRRDPGWMADYARGALRSKRQELQWALEGTLDDQQRSLLARLLRQLEWLEREVAEVESEIEPRTKEYEDLIVRLKTIPGVDRITAWTIVAEIGPDVSAFREAKYLASWAGLCPGNRESGGKRLSSRTRKANCYLRRALCQAAWAATRAKGTFLAATYRRLRGNIGERKAIVALAHDIIVIAYHIIAKGETYCELGADFHDQKRKPLIVARLVKRLLKLGFYAELKPIEPPGIPPEALPLKL